MTAIAVIGFLASQAPGAAGVTAPSADSRAQGLSTRVTAPVRCPDDRHGLAFYRARYNAHRELRGARTEWPAGRKPLSCSDAHQLSRVWRGKARTARRFTERWLERLQHDSATAICFVFGPYCGQAIRVAKCESGWSMTPRAHNGEFLGMFQLGSYARALYGHGDGRLVQARAAYAYFVASGRDWSPWSCRSVL